MIDLTSIILAAGQGKRMNSDKPKVLLEVVFKPMLSWVIDSCLKIGLSPNNIGIVCPENNLDIIKATDNKFFYITQKDRLGTAHAVYCALNFIDNTHSNNVLISLGDAPLIFSETLSRLFKLHKEKNNDLTLLSSEINNPFGYGRIIRNPLDHHNIIDIIEEKEASHEQKAINEVNSGIMIFKTASLKLALEQIMNCNLNHEYYITSAVAILNNLNKKVEALNCHDPNTVLGANTPAELININDIARINIINNFANLGVKFISRDGIIISPDVSIGEGTTIFPNVSILNGSKIGKNCQILTSSHILNSQIGDNVIIKSSFIDNSIIGDNSSVGPFANIRPGSHLANNVKIGDFVEIKNSFIDYKTSVAHLTYIGDSSIGKNVNFGCGCVTVNYDGTKKHKTTVGDNCFIGCNTNLIAPITLGKNVFTAAGSTVTEDLPDNSLCIARSRQVVKENWSKKS